LAHDAYTRLAEEDFQNRRHLSSSRTLRAMHRILIERARAALGA